MRARRLAILLAAVAYFVPWIPWAVGVPRVRYERPGSAECAVLSASLIVLALVAALFGAQRVDRRDYWTKVVAVGLWWAITLAFVPI